MSYQLRSAARNLIGRPVEVRHGDGHVSRGVLRQISDRGLYLEPTGGARFVISLPLRGPGAKRRSPPNRTRSGAKKSSGAGG